MERPLLITSFHRVQQTGVVPWGLPRSHLAFAKIDLQITDAVFISGRLRINNVMSKTTYTCLFHVFLKILL